jgi:hypothetical protein
MVAVREAGKTMFVKNVLQKNAQANAAAVNAAWKAAGRAGTVSGTLVQKMRREMGLTGNLRSRPAISAGAAADRPKTRAAAPRARKPRAGSAGNGRRTRANGAHNATAPTRSSADPSVQEPENRVLEELEDDVDRLIFRVMAVGGMPAVEETLRRARRVLIRRQRG